MLAGSVVVGACGLHDIDTTEEKTESEPQGKLRSLPTHEEGRGSRCTERSG